MKRIRCTQCGLLLGEAAFEFNIVCPLCLSLRHRLKLSTGVTKEILKTEIDCWSVFVDEKNRERYDLNWEIRAGAWDNWSELNEHT